MTNKLNFFRDVLLHKTNRMVWDGRDRKSSNQGNTVAKTLMSNLINKHLPRRKLICPSKPLPSYLTDNEKVHADN